MLRSPATTSSIRSKRPHHVGERSRGNGEGNSDPPKRRRNFLYHPNREQCLPCVLWRQSGSDTNLKHVHPLINSRQHVGTQALPLSQYASYIYDTATFHLTSDDCTYMPTLLQGFPKEGQSGELHT